MKPIIARYALSVLGYNMWRPGNKGLPDFWFSTEDDCRAFAKECGWKLRRLG